MLRRESREHAGDLGAQQAFEELQVHRIELEMQNRALRETQAELEHAVQRYADLYDNLPLAYLTVSPAGQILGANCAACEWFRADRRGLVGRQVGKFLDAYDAGRFAAHLELCLQTGGPATIELTLRTGGGKTVAAQFTSRRAKAAPSGEPQVHIGIADITKIKQAQGALEAVNREQETFNYSISHDLRAPLVTINNYASIVISDFSANLDPQAKGMVERIRVAAQRMEDTLKHLLEYSTLGRQEIAIGPVNLDTLVTNLLIEHRALIEQKNADILIDRPLPEVRGAIELVRQVLANLLTNAIKYVPPGEAPQVRIFAEISEDRAVLKVQDQGIGIDPKFHERIFKVFERLHGYSRYPGSGVGLAIAKRAVEKMNGKIWCESEPGKGSCFSVELPRA
jgi:PAS domain S-box-containing protein